MLRLLTRSRCFALLAAGLLGLGSIVAVERAVRLSSPAPAASRTAGLPSVRLQELQIELELMADTLTFRCPLHVRIHGPRAEVSGSVPTEKARTRALQIVTDRVSVPVHDEMTIAAASAGTEFAAASMDEVVRDVSRGISEVLGSNNASVEITVRGDGRVTVTGVAESHQDRHAVSVRLRHVSGCSCVVNRLQVRPLAREEKEPVALHRLNTSSENKARSPYQSRPTPVPGGEKGATASGIQRVSATMPSDDASSPSVQLIPSWAGSPEGPPRPTTPYGPKGTTPKQVGSDPSPYVASVTTRVHPSEHTRVASPQPTFPKAEKLLPNDEEPATLRIIKEPMETLRPVVKPATPRVRTKPVVETSAAVLMPSPENPPALSAKKLQEKSTVVPATLKPVVKEAPTSRPTPAADTQRGEQLPVANLGTTKAFRTTPPGTAGASPRSTVLPSTGQPRPAAVAKVVPEQLRKGTPVTETRTVKTISKPTASDAGETPARPTRVVTSSKEPARFPSTMKESVIPLPEEVLPRTTKVASPLKKSVKKGSEAKASVEVPSIGASSDTRKTTGPGTIERVAARQMAPGITQTETSSQTAASPLIMPPRPYVTTGIIVLREDDTLETPRKVSRKPATNLSTELIRGKVIRAGGMGVVDAEVREKAEGGMTVNVRVKDAGAMENVMARVRQMDEMRMANVDLFFQVAR
jgi:hypothetical protein